MCSCIIILIKRLIFKTFAEGTGLEALVRDIAQKLEQEIMKKAALIPLSQRIKTDCGPCSRKTRGADTGNERGAQRSSTCDQAPREEKQQEASVKPSPPVKEQEASEEEAAEQPPAAREPEKKPELPPPRQRRRPGSPPNRKKLPGKSRRGPRLALPACRSIFTPTPWSMTINRTRLPLKGMWLPARAIW